MEYKTEFKRWCNENGHTARSISEKIGVSVQSIYSYMEGRRSPSRKTMKLLDEHYHIDSREMFPL